MLPSTFLQSSRLADHTPQHMVLQAACQISETLPNQVQGVTLPDMLCRSPVSNMCNQPSDASIAVCLPTPSFQTNHTHTIFPANLQRMLVLLQLHSQLVFMDHSGALLVLKLHDVTDE